MDRCSSPPPPALASAAAAFEALLAADVACAERDELGAIIRLVRQVRGALDAFDVQIARRGKALSERERTQPAPTPDTPPPRPGPERDDASLVGLLLSSGVQSGKDAKAIGARGGLCRAASV